MTRFGSGSRSLLCVYAIERFCSRLGIYAEEVKAGNPKTKQVSVSYKAGRRLHFLLRVIALYSIRILEFNITFGHLLESLI